MEKLEKTTKITDRVWKILLTHKNDSDSLFWDTDQRILNYQGEGKPIDKKDAKNLICSWVKKELKRLNKVFLYTCPDNVQICLEIPDVTDPSFNMDFAFIQESDISSLYVGWD